MHTKENRVHVKSTSASVSEGPQSFGARYLSCRYTRGYALVVWKP